MKLPEPEPQAKKQRRALVLLSVLVVLTVLALLAYQYSDLMMSVYRDADGAVRDGQTRAFAESGVQFAAAVLSDPSSLSTILGNNPYDNASVFQDVLVQEGDGPHFEGRFSLVAPPYDPVAGAGSSTFRYGVTDESSKININTLLKLDPSGNLASQVLMMLPNMTQDVADAIIDWVDSNDTPRPTGAENETYGAQNPAYQAKDGPLDSLEELLLVQGMTPQLLFGTDTNRNGLQDSGEADAGAFDPGLAFYLTTYTRELNLDSTGLPRIYVNGKGLSNIYTQLQTNIDPSLAAYIIIYLQYGPAQKSGTSGSPAPQSQGTQGGGGSAPSGSGSPSPGQGSNPSPSPGSSGSQSPSSSPSGGAGGSGGTSQGSPGGGSPGPASSKAGKTIPGDLTTIQLNLQKNATTQINSFFELIGTSVVVPGKTPSDPSVQYQCPLNNVTSQSTLLPPLLDKATTSKQAVIPGRVNINTAPEAVLTALPGMTSENVQAILGLRPQPSDLASADPSFQSTAWLLTQAGLTSKQMQQLDPLITTVTQVYRVQSLGYFGDGSTFARVEAVIDTNAGRPRILFQRDISDRGKGYDIAPP